MTHIRGNNVTILLTLYSVPTSVVTAGAAGRGWQGLGALQLGAIARLLGPGAAATVGR